MPSPFPGMDPYLEDPELWSGFHASFIAQLQAQLGPLVRPNFFVRIEERVYVAEQDDPAYRLIVPDLRVVEATSDRPVRSTGGLLIAEPIPVIEPIDEQVRETRLEIRDRSDRSIVTVVEMLSPSNKVPGSRGRESFLQKRREILGTTAHWIEIDLLRSGLRTSTRRTSESEADYLVYLSRHDGSRKGFIWPMPLRERLKVIGIPLRSNHPDVPLDLQETLNEVYNRGGYDLDLNYQIDPVDRLPPADAEWARQMLLSAK